MRVLPRRRVRIAKIVLFILILFPILLLLNSRVNITYRVSITSPPKEAFKRDEMAQVYPELIDGLGNFEPGDVRPRTGPGEDGKPHILRPDQEIHANLSIEQYGMNVVCSDEISLDRTIPDLRHEECKHWNYPRNFPKVSVVVIFHNEAFSVLMRTIHSILNRTPPLYIEEVLLVDDFSDKEDLKGNLEDYIQQFGGKVHLLRNSQREGLINTRSRGAREARGEIIVFLDAHCEVNTNWLPPLITPIFNNRTTITVPIIDNIDYKDFGVRGMPNGEHHLRGLFEWGLEYRPKILPGRELLDRLHHTEPYRSPTYPGGLFAINRNYFIELGLYDPGLLLWGGENLDLSFKVWQCGGSILFIPCSRVAHVTKRKYTFGEGDLAKKRKGDLIIGNYRRVVEIWMDEKFKEYFYRRQPTARNTDMGDISKQLKLKEELQCKSFQWYMENVAYDVLVWFKEPPPNQKWGYLKNKGNGLCIDTDDPVPADLLTLPCNTVVRLNVQGQLGIGQFCILYIKNELKNAACPLFKVDGPWEYDKRTRAMRHKEEGKCMEASNEDRGHVSLVPCNSTNANQKWTFIKTLE